MLGYRVDLGRVEAVQLCKAKKFSEKQVGYLAVGVLLHDGHELLESLTEILRVDLESSNFEVQALAVTAIANIGGRRLAQQFGDSIVNILMSQNSTTQLKKKSSICLLRLIRQNPDIIKPEFMMLKLQQLMGMNHLGLLTSISSLLLGLIQLSGSTEEQEQYKAFLPRVVEILHQMVVTYVSTPKLSHYEYFGVPNPWLQINLLRYLRYFPIPEDDSLRGKWIEIVEKTLFERRVSSPDEASRYISARNSVLFEVFDLVAKFGEPKQLKQAMFLISEFLGSNSSSLRVLGVEKLHYILQICPDMIPFAAPHYKKIFSLMEFAGKLTKIHVVEIMTKLCASECTNEVIQGLLGLLAQNDPEISHLITERLLIVAERGSKSNVQWYVEVMIRILSLSGENIPETNIQRFIDIVHQNPQVQAFAAVTLIQFYNAETSKHSDPFVLVCAVIFREFGKLVAEQEGSSPVEQFNVLVKNFQETSKDVQQEIVTTIHVLHETYVPIQTTIENFLNSMNVPFTGKPSIPQESNPPPTRNVVPSPATTPPTETSPSASPYDLPDTAEFRSLLVNSQQVLVEDTNLQIGMIRENAASSVKLSLYYGNLSQTLLSNIDVSVNNPDMNAILFDADAPPEFLQPNQQLCQVVSALCAKEFVGAPQITICYSLPDGQRVELSAHLPIIATSFISNYDVSPNDFLAAWNQINGAPLENQVMWKTTKGIDINRAKTVMNGLGFAIVGGVEKNPNNLVASCLFNTSSQKIPTLCRLETDAASQMFRITTKSFSPVLSHSISSLVKYFIS